MGQFPLPALLSIIVGLDKAPTVKRFPYIERFFEFLIKRIHTAKPLFNHQTFNPEMINFLYPEYPGERRFSRMSHKHSSAGSTPVARTFVHYLI